jgi:hypothetical protein
MVQVLHRFDDLTQNDIASPKRGIVSMPVPEGHIQALKFMGHLYSSIHFAERLQTPKIDSALIPLLRPDGRRLVGVVLATRLTQSTQQYLLVVSVKQIKTIATHTDLYVSLMGDISALLESVGSIDRLLAPLN